MTDRESPLRTLTALNFEYFVPRPENGGMDCEGESRGHWRICNPEVNTRPYLYCHMSLLIYFFNRQFPCVSLSLLLVCRTGKEVQKGVCVSVVLKPKEKTRTV